MVGLIGKKIGMTSIIDSNGAKVGVTLIQAEPNVISQVKTVEKEGYNALQISAVELKQKHSNASAAGHFKKAGVAPMKVSHEFRVDEISGNLGDKVDVTIFTEGDYVDVIGTSKGKGFQGVVKRHKFGGVGESTHGQHDRKRAPGSVGSSSYPSKVFKGLRMAGRMGGKRVMNINAQVLRIIPEQNILVLKGSIAGHKGAIVVIEK
jgi:large subunit ribosomal protein L3